MNKLKEYNKFLKKYDVNVVEEFFYILFNCIDSSIDRYEILDNMLKNNSNYKKIKGKYKEFYYYVIDYLKSLDISKELFLETQIIDLIDTLLKLDKKYIEDNIAVVMTDVVDLIFFKYKLNVIKFNTNEEIRDYLTDMIGDENIVDLLNVLILSITSLKLEYVKTVPEEDLEHVLRMIILISLYICNKDKNERDDKTDS
jgi:hypothetical protein